jgi:hypothetical protein
LKSRGVGGDFSQLLLGGRSRNEKFEVRYEESLVEQYE